MVLHRVTAATANTMEQFGLDAIKHDVAWKTLNIRHLIDVSPATVDIAREIRYSIIAITIGITSVQLIRLWSDRSRRPD